MATKAIDELRAAAFPTRTTDEDDRVITTTVVRFDRAKAIITAQEQRLGELTEALEDLTCQFAYWNEGVGGISTGGLSALETAFALLGWDDPHALPSGCCDEPGCKKQISCGTPTPSGYRNTCHEHRPTTLPPYAAPDCEPPRETSE